ncbi:hypothetical protein HYFRA_00013122 [Hymenoscyphus fraxineus]|uniref:2EXR domain-containing protein n=1 Tax=Hymenoscyphus fraxineus TaxID=746836 RepID=A0A9N9L3M8_9HELO|nr:hypothetical protein HYFRA_00013122 [Hymenoscyphus fraxineus]
MASKNPMNPNQVFTLFPKLALELRWKIWECTFTPRTIAFEQFAWRRNISDSSLLNDPRNFTLYDILHPYPPLPVGLSVNQESRNFTLRHYQPILGEFFHPKSFYFNFAIDTLDFDVESGMIDHVCSYDAEDTPPQRFHEFQELLSKLQFVAFTRSKHDKKWLTEVLRFHNLKEINIYSDWSFVDLDSWKQFIQFRTAENIKVLEELQSRSVARNQRHFKAPVIRVLNSDLDQPDPTERSDPQFSQTCENLPIMEVTGPINNGQHQTQFGSLIGKGYEAVVPEWVSSDPDESFFWSPDEE